MIKTETIYQKDINGLFKHIKGLKYKKERVGILGGHFLLDYSLKHNRLVPLIQGESNDDFLNKVAEIQVGHFPEKTFEYAIDLFSFFKENSFDAKIMLLVNDHQFPSVNFSETNKGTSYYRTKYYSQNKIPSVFKNILQNRDINEGAILLKNSNRFSYAEEGEDFFLFSEYKYRKKFDRSLKKKILKHTDYFYTKKRKNGKIDIYLKSDEATSNCLTKDGSCGCSGEIMEFIHQRYKNDCIKEFILFVPTSCYIAVSTGIIAILQFLFLEYNEKKVRVQLISQLPVEPILFFNPLNILHQIFNYE